MSKGATKEQIAQAQFTAALTDYRQALESEDPWRIMSSSLRVASARRSHADSREINRVFDEVAAAKALTAKPARDPIYIGRHRVDAADRLSFVQADLSDRVEALGQVVRRHVAIKGDKAEFDQGCALVNALMKLQRCVNGIELPDLTPPESSDTPPGEPHTCPFCGSRSVYFINGYQALTNPELQCDGVAWDMDEYQCLGTCQGRSFFV